MTGFLFDAVRMNKIVEGFSSLNDHTRDGEWVLIKAYDVIMMDGIPRFYFLITNKGKPSTETVASKPSTTKTGEGDFGTIAESLTWRDGKYGDYTFAQNQDGTPNDGTRLANLIDASNGKMEWGEYTYTHKKGNAFINRKKSVTE